MSQVLTEIGNTCTVAFKVVTIIIFTHYYLQNVAAVHAQGTTCNTDIGEAVYIWQQGRQSTSGWVPRKGTTMFQKNCHTTP